MERALIVDDERLARVALKSALASYPDLEVVGEVSSVAEATPLIASLKPTVVFLDVQMPGGTGFALFEAVQSLPPVIFVTGFDEYAIRAFEVNALDYLLKPVDPDQLARALSRLTAERREESPGGPLELDDVVCLQHGKGMKFVKVSEITYIAAADDYSEVYWDGPVSTLANLSIREWERRLPSARFVRCHRGYIVNLHAIDSVEQLGGTWRIHLRDGRHLPMSRRMARDLKARLAP